VYIGKAIKLIAKIKYRDNIYIYINKRVRLRKKKKDQLQKKNTSYYGIWMIVQWKKGKHNTNNISF
jgi:hypothetical protein